MKKSVFIFLLLSALPLMYACSKSSAKDSRLVRSTLDDSISATGFNRLGQFVGTGLFINIDSANKMIESYLGSIGYPYENKDIRSWTLNGDAIKILLSVPSVKSIKFMLGHNMDYIHSGRMRMVPDSSAKALTLIAVGLDSIGNYITVDGEVLDNSMPCPEICPPGTGGNTTILKP